MFLLIALTINLGSLLHNTKTTTAAPAPTCHITTVSYRFVGDPGTSFSYDGENYVIPTTGAIELIASKKATQYQVAGNVLPLDVWPADEFGARTVPMPKH